MLNLYDLERQAASAAEYETSARCRERIAFAVEAAQTSKAARRERSTFRGLLHRLAAAGFLPAKPRPVLP